MGPRAAALASQRGWAFGRQRAAGETPPRDPRRQPRLGDAWYVAG